jgi:hypothetical protein
MEGVQIRLANHIIHVSKPLINGTALLCQAL